MDSRILSTPVKGELVDLASRINESHRLASRTALSTLEHAKTCGELLQQAKDKVGHGSFGEWIAANCGFSPRTARMYLRVSSHWDRLRKTATVADLTMTGAVKLLASERPRLPIGWKPETGTVLFGVREEGMVVLSESARHPGFWHVHAFDLVSESHAGTKLPVNGAALPVAFSTLLKRESIDAADYDWQIETDDEKVAEWTVESDAHAKELVTQ